MLWCLLLGASLLILFGLVFLPDKLGRKLEGRTTVVIAIFALFLINLSTLVFCISGI